MSLDAVLTAAVVAEIDRRLADLKRPELVNQRTVDRIVGMPSRDYLTHVRDGHWPSWSDRRLRYSRTADVVAWIEAHPTRAVVAVVNDKTAKAWARAGLRAVGS